MALNDPVPSNAPDVLLRNMEDIDTFANGDELDVVNRVGNNIRTIAGIERDAQLAIASGGYIPVTGSFESGGTITARNEVLLYEDDGYYYRWAGDLSVPKVVVAASTPATAGGVGAGAWTAVGGINTGFFASRTVTITGGLDVLDLRYDNFDSSTGTLLPQELQVFTRQFFKATIDGVDDGYVISGDYQITLLTTSSGGEVVSVEQNSDEKMRNSDYSVSLASFGIVYNDRTAAATNATTLQDAYDYIAATGLTLYLGSGVIFTTALPKVSDFVKIVGNGNTYWPSSPAAKRSTTADECLPSASQIVLTGTGTRDLTCYGVSSMRASGADRTNPSAQVGYNDDTYRLLSFMEDSATVTRTMKSFSAGLHVTIGARGSIFKGFRVVLDAGGDDGLDGYFGVYTPSEPWSSGFSDWDIGLLHEAESGINFEDVQFIGPYKMAGRMILTIPLQFGFAGQPFEGQPYASTYRDCVFEGYKATSIRGYDQFQIVALTATTADVPWADDHPFPESGTLYMNVNQYGTTAFTYTSITKVAGSPDLLRFNGLSSDPTITYSPGDGIVPGNPGGSSFILDDHCRYSGMQHPSGYPCHYASLDEPMAHPGGGIEISGFKITEITFKNWNIQHIEQIGFHLHDCREIYFGEEGQAEGNTPIGDTEPGLRFIASPHHTVSTYADYPSGDTFNIYVGCSDMIFGDANDFRPYVNQYDVGRWSDPSDNGFFEPGFSRVPQWALCGDLYQGVGLRAPVGGKAGIMKSNSISSGNRIPSTLTPDYSYFYNETSNRHKFGNYVNEPAELLHIENEGGPTDLKGFRISDFTPHVTFNDKTLTNQDFQIWTDQGNMDILYGDLTVSDKLANSILKIYPLTNSVAPGQDNTFSCGTGSFRWSEVFAATGTINTSDANEKQQIRDLTAAEKNVATALKDMIKAFKFNSAVERKGDGARIHVGVIAQEVKSAFEAEGLVAEEYAILCYDEWVNESGETCSRYGVRYEELLAFIISAM